MAFIIGGTKKKDQLPMKTTRKALDSRIEEWVKATFNNNFID